MNSEKKYKEALERAKNIYNIDIKPDEAIVLAKYLPMVFPELKEKNKEDRIKREILELVSIAGNGNKYEEIKDWLEKQKNITYREYVFRPLPGDTIEKAAEKVVKLNGKIVLAFNGAYIPVRNKTKDEIVEEYHNWVKNQSKKSTIKDLEDLFQALPEKIADEKSHQVYELCVYHHDGQCVVDYVGEIDHDSLYAFGGDTLYDAIEKTWNWLRKDSTGA